MFWNLHIGTKADLPTGRWCKGVRERKIVSERERQRDREGVRQIEKENRQKDKTETDRQIDRQRVIQG